ICNAAESFWSWPLGLLLQKRSNENNNEKQIMRNLFMCLSNPRALLGLGGAVILAGSVIAASQKPKAPTPATALNVAVDERPAARDLGGRASFAPVVKKVSPGVVKVSTLTKAHNTGFSGAPLP